MRHTIQLSPVNNNLEQSSGMELRASPFNAFNTRMYPRLAFKGYDFWEPYITSDDSVVFREEEREENDAYCPQFFMQDSFEDFKTMKRNDSDVIYKARVVRIPKWRLKIVNISETGWYAPVIEPLSTKFDGNET